MVATAPATTSFGIVIKTVGSQLFVPVVNVPEVGLAGRV
jgi:hypothetical protein